MVAGVSMPSLLLPRFLLPSQVAGILRHCASLLGHQAEVSGIHTSEVVSLRQSLGFDFCSHTESRTAVPC